MIRARAESRFSLPPRRLLPRDSGGADFCCRLDCAACGAFGSGPVFTPADPGGVGAPDRHDRCRVRQTLVRTGRDPCSDRESGRAHENQTKRRPRGGHPVSKEPRTTGFPSTTAFGYVLFLQRHKQKSHFAVFYFSLCVSQPQRANLRNVLFQLLPRPTRLNASPCTGMFPILLTSDREGPLAPHSTPGRHYPLLASRLIQSHTS